MQECRFRPDQLNPIMSVKEQLVMECTICFDGLDLSEILKTPRILPCGHTFCSDCLANLIQANSSLKCPNCNSKFQNVTLDAVPRNFNFMEIMEPRQKPAESRYTVFLYLTFNFQLIT